MSVSRSRKYQITQNNPDNYGLTADVINEIMKDLMWQYYCFEFEVGEKENTPHFHLYFVCENAVGFTRVKKLFPYAHIEACKGTSQDNRDYIRKEGRHSEKSTTSLPDTFEEHGEMPIDTQAKNETVSADVLNMLVNGCSNTDIINAHPSYLLKINQLNACRSEILQEKYKFENRNDIKVHYIFGKTRTGKTSSVLNSHGNENVYKVTNYKNPFDNYCCEPVLLLDEFHSNLPITEMLQFLDKYPCRLPARYNDKYACYLTVYVVSNIDLKRQYPNVQTDDVETWNAFVSRFSSVTEFVKSDVVPFSDNENNHIEHNPQDYLL